MRTIDWCVNVGKRDFDDKKKIKIPGKLIKPSTKSDILLLFVAGRKACCDAYVDYFGKWLGNEFNIYITELRRKGFTKGKKVLRDLLQIDQSLRDRVETNKVVYIGHSMGMPLAVAAKNKYDLEVIGYYGICTYPSFGDSRTFDADIAQESPLQIAVYTFTDFAPIAFPLTKQDIEEPIRFAIGGNDHALKTYDPRVAQRFIKHFSRFPNSSSEVFAEKNHCFNHVPKDLNPFNKDEPDTLVKDVVEFVYKITQS